MSDIVAKDSVIELMDAEVLKTEVASQMKGFAKTYLVAQATTFLQDNLTDQYMKPIMRLQGNRLGFRTDKDREGGYSMPVVKNCLIEAVLMGVQPVGNHFNIIAGNSYITKEGFGYLLSNVSGLSYEIIPQIPRIDYTKGSAVVDMKIRWKLNGDKWKEQTTSHPTKVNKMMGVDAIIGKATRKARKWLFETVTQSEFSDGDVTEDDQVIIESIEEKNHTDEVKRAIEYVNGAKTLEDLLDIRAEMEKEAPETFQQLEPYIDQRQNELIK